MIPFSRRPALVRRVALLVVASLVFLGLTHAHWVMFDYRFTTITPERVFQSAEIPPPALVRKVREHGIRTVIDLRQGGGEPIEAERRALNEAGVRYVNLPSAQVPDDGTVDAFLGIMERSDTYPVLIHCEHGQGRSVLFAALYRIEFEGWTNESAVGGTRLVSGRGSFAPDEPKGRYLRAYQPRRAPPEQFLARRPEPVSAMVNSLPGSGEPRPQ